MTREYLLKSESPPQCSACQTELTVENVLVWHGMQFVLTIWLSQTYQTCSTKLLHVASLVLSEKLDFITEYDQIALRLLLNVCFNICTTF